MTGISDRELWRRANEGESEAFGVLFDRHAKAIYNFLFRRTTNWSEAEDLTSAVFLHAWRRRAEVVLDRESALPWLLRTADYTIRNEWRSKQRYRRALPSIDSEAGAPRRRLLTPLLAAAAVIAVVAGLTAGITAFRHHSDPDTTASGASGGLDSVKVPYASFDGAAWLLHDGARSVPLGNLSGYPIVGRVAAGWFLAKVDKWGESPAPAS